MSKQWSKYFNKLLEDNIKKRGYNDNIVVRVKNTIRQADSLEQLIFKVDNDYMNLNGLIDNALVESNNKIANLLNELELVYGKRECGTDVEFVVPFGDMVSIAISEHTEVPDLYIVYFDDDRKVKNYNELKVSLQQVIKEFNVINREFKTLNRQVFDKLLNDTLKYSNDYAITGFTWDTIKGGKINISRKSDYRRLEITIKNKGIIQVESINKLLNFHYLEKHSLKEISHNFMEKLGEYFG